jgi:hypothetical protein
MCVASSSQPSPRDLIAGPTPAPYARDGPFAARPDLPHSAVRGSRERGARFLAPLTPTLSRVSGEGAGGPPLADGDRCRFSHPLARTAGEGQG